MICPICERNGPKVEWAHEMAGELFQMLEGFKAKAKITTLRQDSRFRHWEALMARWYETQEKK